MRPRLLSSHKRFLTYGRFVGPPTLIRRRRRLRTCVHVSKIPMPCIWFSVFIIYSRSYMRYAAFLSTYGPHHVGPSSPRTGIPCLCLSFWSWSIFSAFWFVFSFLFFSLSLDLLTFYVFSFSSWHRVLQSVKCLLCPCPCHLILFISSNPPSRICMLQTAFFLIFMAHCKLL